MGVAPTLHRGSASALPRLRGAAPRGGRAAPGARRASGAGGAPGRAPAAAAAADRLTIARPDDWHLHVRDGAGLASVVPATAAVFGRALIMPNLVPPVTTVEMAGAYRRRILDAALAGPGPGSPSSPDRRAPFEPLMTIYLTDRTTPEDVDAAKRAGCVSFKLYPAGATTNSDSGVTSVRNVLPALERMAQVGLPLCVHGEVTDPSVDVFDREREFLDRVLEPLLDLVPGLRVVLEHITTADAADYVLANERATVPAPGPAAGEVPRLAATVTPQHLLLNRNEIFRGGLRPHAYCLPVLKRERHREGVLAAASSGSRAFFLGTDSAPHPRGAKESSCGCAGIYSAPVALPLYALAFERAGALERLEAFASRNGADFYGLPRSRETVTLVRDDWRVPDELPFGDASVVPMMAGQILPWRVEGA